MANRAALEGTVNSSGLRGSSISSPLACVWGLVVCGEDACVPAWLQATGTHIMQTSMTRKMSLFRGCIVSGFSVDMKRRATPRRLPLHFHLTPFSVMPLFVLTVFEHILVSLLH